MATLQEKFIVHLTKIITILKNANNIKYRFMSPSLNLIHQLETYIQHVSETNDDIDKILIEYSNIDDFEFIKSYHNIKSDIPLLKVMSTNDYIETIFEELETFKHVLDEKTFGEMENFTNNYKTLIDLLSERKEYL